MSRHSTTLADAAEHLDRHVERRCDVCGERFRADCYPRTYENQMNARSETASLLYAHLAKHTKAELVYYLRRTHQV